jgi:hypothetical protein
MRRFRGAVALVLVFSLVVLVLAPAAASAQANGSIYEVQGARVPIFFTFSISGETMIAAILTFGNGGNGRWFAVFGTTDGVTGTGRVVNPSGFELTEPEGTSVTFQLDQPGAATGSFAIHGLEAFLSVSSGRFARVFP